MADKARIDIFSHRLIQYGQQSDQLRGDATCQVNVTPADFIDAEVAGQLPVQLDGVREPMNAPSQQACS